MGKLERQKNNAAISPPFLFRFSTTVINTCHLEKQRRLFQFSGICYAVYVLKICFAGIIPDAQYILRKNGISFSLLIKEPPQIKIKQNYCIKPSFILKHAFYKIKKKINVYKQKTLKKKSFYNWRRRRDRANLLAFKIKL